MSKGAHALESVELLVCGAGPAGVAAALAAAARGARVVLIDAQAQAGGGVWRHDLRFGVPRTAQRRLAALRRSARIQCLFEAQVVAGGGGELLVETPDDAARVRYDKLVIATGARELLLPFPGWTLPGVTGAGGLQALVKQGWPIKGARVVVAGSGPLLLASAAVLRKHGAIVLGVHEQATRQRVAKFAAALARWPAHALHAAALRMRLAGVTYRCGEFVVRAEGDDRLRAVVMQTPQGTHRIDCDYLAIGYGLVPNVELAQLLGCRMQNDGRHASIATDERLATSVEHVYAAGEVRGIGGARSAAIEGEIAGLAAVGAHNAATALRGRQRQARRFAALLTEHFALNPDIYDLAQADTVICRCEDVPLGALAGYTDARSAKLATRCGMGACQGRICGAVLAELQRFPQPPAATPLFPARLSTLEAFR